MSLVFELKRRARHVVGPLIGSLLVAYYAYHAVEGDSGICAWKRHDGEIAEDRAERDRLDAEKAALAGRVAMMSPASLESDQLESRARPVLGFVPLQPGIRGNAT